ncbi:MAG: hypothetical protein ACJ8FI_08325, partial [Sphingomicrobium sp.]
DFQTQQPLAPLSTASARSTVHASSAVVPQCRSAAVPQCRSAAVPQCRRSSSERSTVRCKSRKGLAAAFVACALMGEGVEGRA